MYSALQVSLFGSIVQNILLGTHAKKTSRNFRRVFLHFMILNHFYSFLYLISLCRMVNIWARGEFWVKLFQCSIWSIKKILKSLRSKLNFKNYQLQFRKQKFSDSKSQLCVALLKPDDDCQALLTIWVCLNLATLKKSRKSKFEVKFEELKLNRTRRKCQLWKINSVEFHWTAFGEIWYDKSPLRALRDLYLLKTLYKERKMTFSFE